MAEREFISVYFEMVNDHVELVECRFQAEGRTVVAKQRGTGLRQFKWSKAVRVLALALVRLARWKGVPVTKQPQILPLLRNQGRPSAAVILGDAVMQATNLILWPGDLFSLHEPPKGQEAADRLRRWLHFENVQGRRAGEPVTVGAVRAELPPEAVTVFSEGKLVSGQALDFLERRLAGQVDGSFPPLPGGMGLVVTGYLPSIGSEFFGRERALQAMEELYKDKTNRILVIKGGKGEGKTSLAMEWLFRCCTAGRLQHRVVFGWTFFRQAYGAGAGHLLNEFFQALAASLKVPLEEGALPYDTARALAYAMQRTQTLLFLDGLEVLLDEKCPQPGGVTDAALAQLLFLLAGASQERSTWVLVTSQKPLGGGEGFDAPCVEHLKLEPLRREVWTKMLPSGVGESDVLAWKIASGQTKTQEDAAALLVQLKAEAPDDIVASLVRRVLESVGHGPERVLLLTASLFERRPEWSVIRTILSVPSSLPTLTDRCGDLGDARLEEALERLQELKLAGLNAEGFLDIHARVLECAARELRTYFPEAWAAGHRRLREHFAGAQPVRCPDSVEEMEPLFRALWHSCQAGEYQYANDEIGSPRIARGLGGYLVVELGAYQAGLNLLEHYTPDHLEFPPNCDLDAETKALVVGGCSWCLEYLGRWPEAYLCAKAAMRRLTSECSVASVAPIATHLLYLQYFHGDLPETRPVLRKLVWTLLRSAVSSSTLQVEPSFFSTALGLMGSIVASVLWYRGKHGRSRFVLRAMLNRCSNVLKTPVRLAKGDAGPWHALLLLDMGEWQALEKILEEGGLDESRKRGSQVAFPQLLKGRVNSCKAAAARGAARSRLAERALGQLQEGLAIVQSQPFHWFRCAFHIALARHFSSMRDAAAARRSAEACFDLAKQEGYGLMEIDSRLLLDRLEGKSASEETAKKLKAMDYQPTPVLPF